MHELSLCQNVLDILEGQARQQDFSKVLRVRLEIGELAGVESDAIKFGFSAVMRGTLAEQAELDIVSRPGEARCLACETTIIIHHRCDACPRCGSYGLRVIGGTEMRILELEVE